MTTDSYKHPKWQQTRLRIMERDEWKCVACGDTESTLHVHHAYYQGEPWETKDEWLQTLCEDCHKLLGVHPKAGVYWHRDTDGGSTVAMCWCPQCGGFDFEDKGSYFKCFQCGFDTSSYTFASRGGVLLGKHINVVPVAAKKKPKEYSLGWLKGMMTKVRKGGATDLQIFEVLFPGSAAIDCVERLVVLATQFADALRAGDVSEEQEIEAVELLVKLRREIQRILADKSVVAAGACLSKEATDGTEAR